MVDVRRQLEMMSDVQLAERKSEVRHAKRRDDIEQPEKADSRAGHDDLAVLLDAGLGDFVREVERDRGAAAEANDVDVTIAAGVRAAQRVVRGISIRSSQPAPNAPPTAAPIRPKRVRRQGCGCWRCQWAARARRPPIELPDVGRAHDALLIRPRVAVVLSGSVECIERHVLPPSLPSAASRRLPA